MVVLNALGRDLMPKQHVGVFSGIRMVFFVLIPMVIGPFIGSMVIKNSSYTYVDEFNVIQSTPTPGIFLAGSIFAILAFIPIYFINKNISAHIEEEV
jgi:MFS family permease